MKKSIFIFVAFFATTVANAQITLEHTFTNGYIGSSLLATPPSGNTYSPSVFDGFADYNEEDHTLTIYNPEDYSIEVVMYNVNQKPDYRFLFLSKNIFTTDGTYSYLLLTSNGANIIDQNGEIIFTFPDDVADYNAYLLKVGNSYKLAFRYNGRPMYIYSLPGDGEATEISTLSSPKRSARKIAHEGQVLVETDVKTYTVTGQEVK